VPVLAAISSRYSQRLLCHIVHASNVAHQEKKNIFGTAFLFNFADRANLRPVDLATRVNLLNVETSL
jgi:hypothetical protein